MPGAFPSMTDHYHLLEYDEIEGDNELHRLTGSSPITWDTLPPIVGRSVIGPPGMGIVKGAAVYHDAHGVGNVMSGWDNDNEAIHHREVDFSGHTWSGEASELCLYLNPVGALQHAYIAVRHAVQTQTSAITPYDARHNVLGEWPEDAYLNISYVTYLVGSDENVGIPPSDLLAVSPDPEYYEEEQHGVIGLHLLDRCWVDADALAEGYFVTPTPHVLPGAMWSQQTAAILDPNVWNKDVHVAVPGIASDLPQVCMAALLTELKAKLPLNLDDALV